MGKLFTKGSMLWRQPKAGWTQSRLAPKRPGVLGKIGAGMSESAAARNRSLAETPLSFAAHRGLTFLASTIPMASLVFDSLTIAHIIQQFDPKFKIASNQLTDEAYKTMMLAHVQNKVLSQNQGESQQGIMMLRTMRRYAEKVSRQAAHPRNESARRFLTHLNTAQKHTDKPYIQRRKENDRGVQFHKHVALKGFRTAPAFMQKYAGPAINREQIVARLQARRRLAK
ncbi:hypothetical protein HYV43_02380 [Candidatus Micrarchaeota archaeon]|nr:hypothetical protein [Candidatus Micrarchaeota archaeon]